MLENERAFNFITQSFSHKFRTPLTVIRGFTELLLESQNLNNMQQEDLEMILKNTDRLEQLIVKTELILSEMINFVTDLTKNSKSQSSFSIDSGIIQKGQVGGGSSHNWGRGGPLS
jgi:K+-sensing histidine kinase KdpD